MQSKGRESVLACEGWRSFRYVCQKLHLVSFLVCCKREHHLIIHAKWVMNLRKLRSISGLNSTLWYNVGPFQRQAEQLGNL